MQREGQVPTEVMEDEGDKSKQYQQENKEGEETLI